MAPSVKQEQGKPRGCIKDIAKGKSKAQEKAAVAEEPETSLALLTDDELPTSADCQKSLKKSPKDVQQLYHTLFKWGKATKCEKKRAFVTGIMREDFKAEIFKRRSIQAEINVDRKQHQCMSWKQLLVTDDECVIKARIAQGKLESQPHENLDPDAPSTLELPEHLRFQYRHTTTMEWQDNMEEERAELGTGDKDAPELGAGASADGGAKQDDGEAKQDKENDEEAKANAKKLLFSVKRCLSMWSTTEPELTASIAKYDGEQYVAQIHAEAVKLKRKCAAQVNHFKKYMQDNSDKHLSETVSKEAPEFRNLVAALKAKSGLMKVNLDHQQKAFC